MGDKIKYSDLTEEELRFLMAWHAAPDEAKLDAFALLVNGRQHDNGDGCKIFDIENARQKKLE